MTSTDSVDNAARADGADSVHLPNTAAPNPGSSGIDRAEILLDALGELPLAEHPDAYEQVHAQLSDALASIDDA
jgi:hypothetical protein